MPTIGWFEILIIVTVAIIIVGPKDFPLMLKKVGSWFGTAKRYIGDFQKEVSDFQSQEIEVKDEVNNKKKDRNDKE